MERRKKMMMPHNCLEFVGRFVAGFGSVGSVLWFRFFALHKKFFQFSKFFS